MIDYIQTLAMRCYEAHTANLLDVQGPAMVDGKYPPAFPLRHQKKDMGLAEELGKATSQPLKVANSVHELYKQVSKWRDL